METRFEQLSEKSSYRRQRLLDSNQLFNFFREADEVESWIADKESIAMSDDYGRDIEHVETLLKKFEDFTRDLVTSGERIASLTTQAQTLLDEGHSEGEVSNVGLFIRIWVWLSWKYTNLHKFLIIFMPFLHFLRMFFLVDGCFEIKSM